MHYLVGVGSNIGDRMAHISRAASSLPAGMTLEQQAPCIETPAVGGPRHSGPFLNTAWVVETGLGPNQLLLALRRVEWACGRVRSEYFGPRRIDLDLLLAKDGRSCSNPFLQLPHPAMAQRRFVLQPAVAIAADWVHPHYACTLAQLLAACEES